MKNKPLKIVFLQGDYPAQPKSNPNFGRSGIIHRMIEASLEVKICWHFIGGFISDSRFDFWSKIETADAFFTSSVNMDHANTKMHGEEASESMQKILRMIKIVNPNIKIIIYSWDSEMAAELESYGKLITDLHEVSEIKAYLK